MRYLLPFILLLAFGGGSLSANAPNPSSCVILVVNRLTLDDIASGETPFLQKTMEKSGIGLLNLRTSGGFGPEKILLGISAGSPATSNTDGGIFLESDEDYYRVPGEILYRRLLGTRPKGSIINPLYASILQQNQSSEFLNQIGVLGSMVRRSGRKTGLWGQSDPDTYAINRSAGLIIADANGQIDAGQISDAITMEDSSFPSGRRLDADALWRSYQASIDDLALAAIDWGELDVLDNWIGMVPPSRYPVLKKTALQRLDRFFQKLYYDARIRNQRLVLLSVAPPRATPAPQRLGLIILFDPEQKPGLLSSLTTKTAGMVTPYDLHRYLVQRLNLPGVKTAIGALITTTPGNTGQAIGLYHRLLQTEAARAPVLIFLIYLTSFSLVAGGIFVITGQHRGRSVHILHVIMELTMALPVTLLGISLLQFRSPILYILGALGLAGLFTMGIRRGFRQIQDQMAAISGITILSLLTEALLGGRLSPQSPLGYSLITGARYYGLGNEFTGIVVGAILLTSGLYLHRAGMTPRNLRRVALGFLLSVTLITFPSFGANIGDLIPLFTVFSITLLLFWGKKINLRRLTLLGCLVCLVFIGFAVYDATRSSPTHLGQLVQDITLNGWQSAVMMIERKLAMNWRLIQYSRWTTVVLIVLILFPITLRHPRGPLRRVFHIYSPLRPAYIGIALAGLGSFFFNDSGIVAAATTYLIPSLAMLLLMIDTMESPGTSDVQIEAVKKEEKPHSPTN